MNTICLYSYYDKFFELHSNEAAVIDWEIIRASFTSLEVLFVDIDEDTGFYNCELGVIGSVRLAYVADSGLIYMDDVEFSTFYTTLIRDKNFIKLSGRVLS